MMSSIIYSPPKTVVIGIVIGATIITNSLSRPKLEGLTPQESISGTKQYYPGQFAFCPSDYVEVHMKSDNVVTHPRTVSAIPLHPCPQNLNEWTFYSLQTGRTFTQHYDSAFLMPRSPAIVDRVNSLAVRDPTFGDPELGIDRKFE